MFGHWLTLSESGPPCPHFQSALSSCQSVDCQVNDVCHLIGSFRHFLTASVKMSRRSQGSRDSGRGSSINSSVQGSRKSYQLSSSLNKSSHVASAPYVLPDSSQLSEPSFDISLPSMSSTSSLSTTRTHRSSHSRSHHSLRITSSAADVSEMRRTLGTCRLVSPTHTSSSRLKSKSSDVSRYRAGVIDTSYIDSFSADFNRQGRDHSQSMLSINSSFNPQLNSTELSIYPTGTKSGNRGVLQSRQDPHPANSDADILICGKCRLSFTSWTKFQKHKERGNCIRCKCNGQSD